jgi:hypothetical protein
VNEHQVLGFRPDGNGMVVRVTKSADFWPGREFMIRGGDGRERLVLVNRMVPDGDALELRVEFLDSVQAPGACTGKCKGTDRPATDSPARYGTSASGVRGVFCDCCGQWLVKRGKTNAASLAYRFVGGVMPEGVTLWVCDNCEYDIQSIAGLKAT